MKRSPLPPRRTALARRCPLRRTAMKRSQPRPKLPVAAREAVADRSEGMCEITVRLPGVCTGRASQVHHRALLGMGGCRLDARHRADRLSSLLHGCAGCHAWVHEHRAEANGWIIPRGSDASEVPLWRRGVLVYLDDLSGVHDFEDGCE